MGDSTSALQALNRPPSVLIVGDSMTQGGEGDFTWRYRLWEWTRQQQVPITFTGPYKGTQESEIARAPQPPPLYKHEEPDQPIRCHGGYARETSPDFDSYHFAVWGRQCAVAKDVIEDVVRHHDPDVILVMLGFNDLGWFVSDPAGLLDSMKQFVINVRSARPNAILAVANVPQRTPMDGREDLPRSTSEYNKLLSHAVSEWSSQSSPVHLVDVCKEYTADTATFDGLHPNSLGDYQIARAFSIVLCHDLNLGHFPLKVPRDIPKRPLSIPHGFQLVSSPVGVTAVWDQGMRWVRSRTGLTSPVYGATGYEFRSRIDDHDFSCQPLLSNRWDSHWAADGWKYEAQVCSLYGNQARSQWTDLQTAVAHPQLASAPTHVAIAKTTNGVQVSWLPPEATHERRILQYTVLWRDKDGSMFFPGLAAFKESPGYIDELQQGHRYDICMLTWTTAGEGSPGDWQEFVVDR